MQEELQQRIEKLESEVAELKQAGRALSETNELYRAIVEDMPAMICRFLPDGTLTFVNKTYCQYFHKEKDTLLNRNFFQFIPLEEQQTIRERFMSLSPEQPTTTYEHQVIAPDGELLWQEWTDKALFNENGDVIEFQSISQDITERMRAAEALRESEKRFRELAELMPEMIFETDLDGNLTFVNQSAFGFFLYTKEEFAKGLNALDMLVAEDRERAAKNIREILGGEDHGLTEYTAVRKDGTTFPILIHSLSIYRDGRPAGLRGSIIDISEKKRLESELIQAQKMEAVGTLAGGVAHDFNNLLTGIQGTASLMLLDIDSTHPFYEKIRNVEQYVRNGAALSRQLLGFARSEKTDVTPTNLNVLMGQIADMFGRTKKEITVNTTACDDLWTVEVDRGQIEQVILNLLVNAWQAMPGGGRLYLETANVAVDEDFANQFGCSSGRYVKLSVADTGVGMDTRTRERIFEPFFTTKEMGRGSGLGLSSAYGIVKNHNGFLNVQSTKGEGSIFEIYLPATDKCAVPEDQAKVKIKSGKETILFVDDEPMIVDTGKKMLERLGYDVVTASSGKTAVETYKRMAEKIDIIILDLIMPGTGGIEVYHTLTRIDPAVRILLTSGYSISPQTRKILETNGNSFLQKPFDIQELSKKLRSTLDRE